MGDVDEVEEASVAVMAALDDAVDGLSQAQYAEVLEDLISSMQSRLSAVRGEIASGDESVVDGDDRDPDETLDEED